MDGFGQQRFIIRNVIGLVAEIRHLYRIIILHIANRITEKKNPKLLVPDEFSVKFMSKKAGKMRKIFVLHLKIRSHR